MTPERWQQVKTFFDEALTQPAAHRAAFLDQVCADDAELRAQLEVMLAADSQPDDLLDQPAYAAAANLLTAQPAEAGTEMLAGQQLGVYQILHELGRGGMGAVYLARDTRLERSVALKLLPARLTSEAERVRRFEREAHTASALNHPHIVTVYDFGCEGGRHYIATEFVAGQTLRALLHGGALKLDQALGLVTQIASALEAAHAAGIIHRDIKPENVMVRPDGYVKVLDFGLAKLTESYTSSDDAVTRGGSGPSFETGTGVVLGTVSYMSPEQARGQKVDARSDLFSLGVMLYELVTGERPFTGPTINHVLVAILDHEPAPLAQHWPAAPPLLQRIVSLALSKERTQRYQRARALLTDLKALQEELMVAAHLERGRSGGELRAETKATVLQLAPRAASIATSETKRTTARAERIVGQLKHHKLALLITLAVLVAAAGVGYYLRTKNSEVAINSIAVLPFANQNSEPETDYLADGLTESIINNLTQLADLRVINRNSVFRYKGKTDDPLSAGKTLGARAVVTGRLLQRGEELIISAELVDVRDNKQLWGDKYNRKLADVFAVQEEIAQEISAKLRLKLTEADRQHLSKHPTQNLKAFQYYMQGRKAIQERTRENTLTAIKYYEKALGEDPNYALAYTGLADAYTILGARAYIAPSQARRKTEEMARKALALDENLAEAHTALGETWWYAPYNFAQSDRAFRRALELNPGFATTYAYLCYSLAGQDRFEESLQMIARARELDPLSSAIARIEAFPYLLKRDYAKALELLRQATELGPPFTQTWEIGAYLPTGLFEQALKELEQAKGTRPNDPLLIGSTGIVYAAQGKRAEALQIIKELEAMSGASLSEANWITKIYAALNEQEKALSLLERSLAADEIGVFYKNEPMWDSIRHTPRFAELLRRMGIPQ